MRFGSRIIVLNACRQAMGGGVSVVYHRQYASKPLRLPKRNRSNETKRVEHEF